MADDILKITEHWFNFPIKSGKRQIGQIIGEEQVFKGKPVLRIRNVGIDDVREIGKGRATTSYSKLADIAHRSGRELVSDADVSESAGRVYGSLARRGYQVQLNPKAVLVNGSWQNTTRSDAPIFRVTGKVLASKAARSTIGTVSRAAGPIGLGLQAAELGTAVIGFHSAREQERKAKLSAKMLESGMRSRRASPDYVQRVANQPAIPKVN